MYLNLNNLKALLCKNVFWRYTVVGIINSLNHITIATIFYYFIFENFFAYQLSLILANVTAFIISNFISFFCIVFGLLEY